MKEPPTRTDTSASSNANANDKWMIRLTERVVVKESEREREEKKKIVRWQRGTNNGHERREKKGRRFWENKREKKLNSAHIPRLYLRNRLRRTRRFITSSGIIHVCVHLLHHSRLRAGSSGGRATTTSVAHLWTLDSLLVFQKWGERRKPRPFEHSLSLNLLTLLLFFRMRSSGSNRLSISLSLY